METKDYINSQDLVDSGLSVKESRKIINRVRQIMEEKGMYVPGGKWKVADKKLTKDYLKHRRKYETVI